MSLSSPGPQPQIKQWSLEDVHHWLMTEVKVDEAIAERFTEEEVLGEYLVDFQKKDILDLKIKHGPAVKITSHLERLKQGSQHESQIPAYVERWTKEQVNQWLRQHVNIYKNHADRLQDEDVSGDCLVYFTKQDLLDLDVKSGPAVKILAALVKLNNMPEPTLQPPDHANTDQTLCQPATSVQHEAQLTQASQPKEPEHAPKEAQLPKEEVTQRQEPNPTKQAAKRKQADAIKVQPNVTVEIQDILSDLSSENFKEFHFHLREHSKSKGRGIPLSKLRDKDTIDTATLLTDHYGSEEALEVAVDILQRINQNDHVHQLKRKLGQMALRCQSKEVLKREDNQGDKLKNLLTCGGNSLNAYERFVVVVNKSSPEQIGYLQFLSILKLFCVLDFDPDSNSPGGVCQSYRDTRAANLHFPSQYQGQIHTVMKDLNLYKQTSWVFCNGRNDLDSGSNPEFDYKNWLRKSCKDIESLVSFICAPDVLPHGRCLIIFLLLSPVLSEKDPVFDTYRAFLKNTEEENIITICESRTYGVWSELIQDKCECDINQRSVYELNLSEVNGTVMAFGPINQSSRRLLPSPASSHVVLKQRDEDLMTALDILCLNQCENIYDENSQEFQAFRIKVEEEFYRGGKVKWWNFYFCDKDIERPFVKRDKYKDVIKLIRSEFRHSTSTCVQLNLFHHPGCGGTTLAMHVMWDLRQEFRCAVLKDNVMQKEDVAIQVQKLMKLESEKPTPVLLLVDDSKEAENLHDLVNCIHNAEECVNGPGMDDAPNCQVIIINCVRSHNPKDQYKRSPAPCQYITTSLNQKEQNDFEKKLQELKETHEKPENFYSFMIMKRNFDKKYVDDLAHNTLDDFDFSTEKARLFAFLALLNTYVDESEISVSLSEDFFGMKMFQWKEDSVMDRMKPYSNLLIIDAVEEWGYKGIRILHQWIASACLEELERNYHLKISEIALEMLHCDLFFRDGVVKHRFVLLIQQMLIERRRIEGREREQFSHFIEEVHKQQGRQTVQDIFVKASSRFETSASIPQALARYLYINEQDFPEALKWAEKAKNIKENPFTLDTVGQVYKKYLKSNILREKQETSQNPEDLDSNIKLADNAIKAFKRAQELAKAQDEYEEKGADDDSEDYPRRSYNVNGYVGVLEVAFLLFQILGRLQFFEESDPAKKKYLLSFLQSGFPITSVYKEDNDINNRHIEIIKEHNQLLVNLKTEVKTTFEHINRYYTYFKGNDSEFDSKNRSTIYSLFKRYVDLFCTASEEVRKERDSNPNLNMKIGIEEHRRFLEQNQADTFTGILQHLDRRPEEIEDNTKCYAFLQNKQQFINKRQRTKETINYILSNIVLYIVNPKSKYLKTYNDLSRLLLKTLQDVGLGYPFPDPYYLALLLLWPSPTQENTEIKTYVNAIRKSSRKSLFSVYPKRSTVAHLYLGKGDGLQRLVSKPQLDKSFKKIRRHLLAQLWRSGDIFKDKAIISRLHRISGTIEQGEVFANQGALKVPVRPALLGTIRSGLSTEKVSFYLGFAINGLLAYDIQYEN
ncbi:sterile alpha motif domain-containing protein 9-like [Genypterus blacodes]|uniref:sterile alpha motif domain-containing protein 9-like n=1 Tax=Genypterus blacodes TaxID=154954 RepID=UPI003F76967D